MLALGTKLITVLANDVALGAITMASSRIYAAMAAIMEVDSVLEISNIQTELWKLDLGNRLRVINAFFEDIKNKHSDSKSFNEALNGVHVIIADMEKEFEAITLKIEAHKNLFFYSWRRLDCNVEVANIKAHNQLLKGRFDLFLAISQLTSRS